MRAFIFSRSASRVAAGSTSSLLSTTMSRSLVISPITRHSAVWVWMPLPTSMTSSIRSMICAPPMIVRMSDAWPGQSTRVICICSCSEPCATRCAGTSITKEEKPRSSVMPRSLDCGLLSMDAVEATVESARVRDVLPESTCPSTPTLMFSVLPRPHGRGAAVMAAAEAANPPLHPLHRLEYTNQSALPDASSRLPDASSRLPDASKHWLQ